MALKGNTPEERIWNFLMDKIGNAYGVAGLMGNLHAESGLNTKNLENLCERKLKDAGKPYCTDETYTAAVDSGAIGREEFLHPLPNKQYGYGLAQWTSAGRKAGLYDLVKSRGVSIGDLEAQLDYLDMELRGAYKAVLGVLKTASSVRVASDIVLIKFESPADQGDGMQRKRAEYGQIYYDRYSGSKTAEKEVMGGGTMLSNCGHDEKGKYTGGAAGDQTGGEWALIKWYNRPWKCVLRHPDAEVRKKISQLAKEAAVNDRIGYDQGQRYTFWENLKASSYLPSKITAACEADCSSGVAAIVKAVGFLMGIQALKDISIYLYTGNMRAGLKAAGFEVLTDSKYLTSDQYLLDGDVLLNDGCHVATNIGNGSGAAAQSTTPSGGAAAPKPAKPSAKVDPAQSLDKSLAGTYLVTATALNLRTGAGTNKGVIVEMPNGAKVQCYGYYTSLDGVKWLYVVYNGQTGFCSMKYLKKC